MRKKFILILVGVTFVISMNAQLRMNYSGTVSIGTAATGRPPLTGKLDVGDGARLGNIPSLYYSGRYGKFGDAVSYEFNPEGVTGGGIIMEQGNGESAGIYLDADYAVIWSPGDGEDNPAGGTGYLLKVIDEDGMVLRWYIDGSGTPYRNSDARLKENINNLSKPLTKIKKINGVSYDFKLNEDEIKKKDSLLSVNGLNNSKILTKSQRFGFLAQDLEEIFPELVQTDKNGYKYVNYDGLIPILVEGIKELQTQVEYLNREIVVMQKDCCNKNFKSNQKSNESVSSSISNERSLTSVNSLEQNIPNPFTKSTQINFFLTENVINANLYIYNMNGTQLKSIQLHQKGNGSVTINGGEFQAGMYIYTLIADGQVIDTKQMILTD